MAENKILVVEDDQSLIYTLSYNLHKEGYIVLTANDGIEAIEVARRESPDLIILDIMLPKLDGFEVCRILRKETAVPIMMLTVKNEEVDKVVGLELGADDYVTKPFSLRELLARVKAMLRRAQIPQPEQVSKIKSRDLEIDLARHEVTLAGSPISLRPKEFDLLAFLVKNKGFAFSREQLLEKVWGYDYAGDTNTVDVHIYWLRSKIETDPANPSRILTVRGVGYRFEV
jgi:two-component system OmpR family response regulator